MSESSIDRRALLRTGGIAAAATTVAGGAVALSATPALAAGATFQPVDPYRAYDSRLDTNGTVIADDGPNSARLWKIPVFTNAAGQRVITVNASAVAYTLTVVASSPNGYLTVQPGNINAAPSASSINWGGPRFDATDSAIANSGIVKVASAVVESGKPAAPGVVGVFCGGGGRARFIIDITGYFV